MDFALSDEHRELQRRCRKLAADFAIRAAEHDRDASHPVENYRRLLDGRLSRVERAAEMGRGRGRVARSHDRVRGIGAGCPSTALAFNMHASVVMPVLESPEVGDEAKARMADLVVRRKADRRQFLRARPYLADRRAAAQRPGAPDRRRLQRHRAQDVRLDARSGRLRAWCSPIPTTRRAPRPASSCWCRRMLRAAASSRTGTCSACARPAATRWSSKIAVCRTSRRVPLGRHPAVPAGHLQLVLGLVHGGVSRRRGGGL